MPELRIRVSLLVLAVLLCCRIVVGAVVLKPLSLQQFFLEPNKPVELRWAVAATPELSYTVRDYAGAMVNAAHAPVTDGTLALTQTLPPGYYELSFAETPQTFGLCALPPYQGAADSFFGIDSALSWLVSSEKHEEFIAMLKRCGISISRERMNWGEVAPAGDRVNPQTKYTPVRELYRKYDLPVLEVFHDAPGWTGKEGAHGYPQDQLAVARSWAAIGNLYSAAWGGLEIWNEPDLSAFSGDASPEQYLPMVKAIGYSLHQAGIRTPLGGGVFSSPSDDFLQACAQNGLLDSVDFLSFHHYGDVLDVESQVARYRAWLRANGKESLPLWLTECGKPWTRGPERPPRNEDAASALAITMKTIEARACGVARHFPFVFPYYEENAANFGMLGKEGTPLRAMTAYAHVVRALAFRQFIGDLRCDDPAIRRARVFIRGEQALVVLYTGVIAPGATVKVGVTPAQVKGIDGRRLLMTTPGLVPIPDGLSYFTLNMRELIPWLRPDSRTLALNIAGQKAPPARGEPSPIILSYRLQANGAAPVSSSSQGYLVSSAAAPQFPVHVLLSNLSDTPHQVTLHWQLEAAEGRPTPTDGPRLTVPPMGTTTADWTVDLSPIAGKGLRLLLITATSTEAIPIILPLALPLTTEAEMATLLANYPLSTPLTLTDLQQWQPVAAADAHLEMCATPDAHWLLNVTFGTSDPWVYPQLTVPAKSFAQRQALLLRAKCANPATVRVILWQTGGGAYVTSFPAIPADGRWHNVAIEFAQFVPLAGTADPLGRLTPEQVTKIALGMNSPSKSNTLEVSDVYVVGE